MGDLIKFHCDKGVHLMAQYSRETQRLNNAEWYKVNTQRVKQNRIDRMRKAALKELEIAAAAGKDIVKLIKSGEPEEPANRNCRA